MRGRGAGTRRLSISRTPGTARAAATALRTASPSLTTPVSMTVPFVLSTRTPEEVDLILPDVLSPLTPNTVTDRAALHEQLAGFRNVGYAHEREENTPGLGCFAVALPYRNPVLDAMSCSVPLGRLDPEHERQVISALLDAARTITELLRQFGR